MADYEPDEDERDAMAEADAEDEAEERRMTMGPEDVTLSEVIYHAPASQEGDGQPEGWRERLAAFVDAFNAACDHGVITSELGQALTIADLRAALAAASQGGGGLADPTYSEREMADAVEARDRAEEWADRLAYAVAPVEVIGEHTSANTPWVNALAILQERGPGGGLDREALPEPGATVLVRALVVRHATQPNVVVVEVEDVDGPERLYVRAAALAPLLTGGGAS